MLGDDMSESNGGYAFIVHHHYHACQRSTMRFHFASAHERFQVHQGINSTIHSVIFVEPIPFISRNPCGNS